MLSSIPNETAAFGAWIILQFVLLVWAFLLIKRSSAFLSAGETIAESHLNKVGHSSIVLLTIWIVTCFRWQSVDGSENVATISSAAIYALFLIIAAYSYPKLALRFLADFANALASSGLGAVRYLLRVETIIAALRAAVLFATSLCIAYLLAVSVAFLFAVVQESIGGGFLISEGKHLPAVSSAINTPMKLAFKLVVSLVLFASFTLSARQIFLLARYSDLPSVYRIPNKIGLAWHAVSNWLHTFSLPIYRVTLVGLAVSVTLAFLSDREITNQQEDLGIRRLGQATSPALTIAAPLSAETVFLEPISLCTPPAGALEWAYADETKLALSLTSCEPPEVSKNEAIIVVGLSSKGISKTVEEARSKRRLETAASWLEALLPSETTIFTIDLGMGTTSISHRVLRSAFGVTRTERPLLGFVVRPVSDDPPNWDSVLLTIEDNLQILVPDLKTQYTKYEVARWGLE